MKEKKYRKKKKRKKRKGKSTFDMHSLVLTNFATATPSSHTDLTTPAPDESTSWAITLHLFIEKLRKN